MPTTNITKVYLLSVPLESDYKNTLYFANASSQQSYFQSKIVKSYTDFSYQRKDNIIRIPEIYDSICHCNYVMYQNSNYSNKWFYAFINKMEYINVERTDITIETDVIQTWLFDYTVKSSFVEREHVSDDSVGANTVPESLETGEYISCNLQPSQKFKLDHTNCVIVIAVTELLQGFNYTTFNAHIPMGLYYIAVKSDAALKDIIKSYASNGKVDSISSVFIAPESFFFGWGTVTIDGNSYDYSTSVTFELTDETVIPRIGYLGQNYQPRNKKLLTYPYSFLQVSNNNGAVTNYRWEDFYNVVDPSTTIDIKFKLKGTITPGCDIKVYPSHYKNILDNFDEGLNMGKLPIGSWLSDVYTNWLTQNGVNIALNIAQSGVDIVGSAINKNASGAINGSFGVAQTVAEVYRHSMIPPQSEGNANCGDVSYQFGLTNLTFKNISIKNEYSAIIDGYFDMFGYKVNAVKVPNKAHRSNYWYTKTIDVSINGDIPQDDMIKIKNCYNNGIRFWRNASNIEDYSVNNSIV